MSSGPHRSRTTALARAERGSAPVSLTTPQKKLLERALTEGADLRDTMQAAVLKFGRFLLTEIFDGDASRALDIHGTNPVWLELTRRAGGPTLGISRRMLYVALAIAANDHRINDQAWQRLDVPRKELLLPLREVARLRDAAHHVSKFNLSFQGTREYVTEVMGSTGKERQARVTRTGLLSRVKKLRESLGTRAVVRRTEELSRAMTDRQRAEVLREIESLVEVLQGVSHAVKSSKR